MSYGDWEYIVAQAANIEDILFMVIFFYIILKQ